MSETRMRENPWATGLAVFAGAMLLTVGVLQILQAIVALVDDEFYVVGDEYTFKFDTTTWGWIHLVLGALMVLIGFFIFTGNPWARGAGIGIAILAIIGNFMWMEYYPFWSIVLIALDVAIIWALATYTGPDDRVTQTQ
jgi:H+/Cl- antiporter ClcA